MTRPVIGVTAYREPATWGVWQRVTADLIPADYTQAVAAAGGLPVVIPVTQPRPGDPETVVDRLDGLLLSGGSDIDPARYGQAQHPKTLGVRDLRDQWELALLRAAYARDLPVLGVCRGMQLMAVEAGGRLVQDLPDDLGETRHTVLTDAYRQVAVQTAPGSMIAELLGPTVAARCHHHQAVLSHPGFLATASAGSVTEAIEATDHRFRIAVQWHPEVCEQPGLFTGLVDACREPSAQGSTAS